MFSSESLNFLREAEQGAWAYLRRLFQNMVLICAQARTCLSRHNVHWLHDADTTTLQRLGRSICSQGGSGRPSIEPTDVLHDDAESQISRWAIATQFHPFT